MSDTVDHRAVPGAPPGLRGEVPEQRLPGPPRRRPKSGTLFGRTVLRRGVGPMLVLLDVSLVLGLALLGGPVRGWVLTYVALVVALLASASLYRSRLTLSGLDDVPALLGRALAAGAITVSASVVLDQEDEKAAILRLAVLTGVLLPLCRGAFYALVRHMRSHGVVAHATLILGAGHVGSQIARILLDHPDYGLVPVGFLDDDPLLLPEDRPVSVLGTLGQLAQVITEFGVQDVIVAFSNTSSTHLVEVLRTCDRLSCEIFVVPRLFEMHAISRDVDSIWGLPLVRIRRATFRSRSWGVKRAFDIACSGTALLLLSPVLAVLALAVRLEGGPGVLFRQTRVGLDGRVFDVIKFRSMRPVDDEESATRWSIATDDRVGPVGRLLRRTSLDELPQLWNILTGEMSIVGPRPERPYFVDQFTASLPRYMARHRVPSGLTGWAQVHGLRGDTSVAERARFDNFYIENWSLWLDLKIILRTLVSVVRGDGR